jgi:hypothetical protein
MSVNGAVSVQGTMSVGSVSESNTGFVSTQKSIGLSQTGDQYGATSLTLENRFGMNGALFQNSGLELVDFGFLDSAGFQNNIRSESGALSIGYNNSLGEFDVIANATSHGGGSGVNVLVAGVATTQLYPTGAGKVSINVAGGTNPNAALAVNGGISVGSYAGSAPAPANGLIVSGSVGIGSAAPAGLLSVGAANQFQVDASGDVIARQIVGSGASPTASAGSAAGSGASVTIVGTVISGVVNLTTGTATTNSAAAVNVAWSLGSATPPQGCSLMPRNAAAASATGTIFTGAPGTTGWTANVGATALAAGTSYSWSYQCF